MRKGQPLFTVITITYNSGEWIKEAIESVLNSTFTDFELIISDDSSTDDTWSIITEYKDPRIRSWRNEQNIGEYPNRNKVIEAATGKYILFVDGDDILYRNSLRNLSEYIIEFPEAGMIWGLNPQHFPFYVFPFMVRPTETMMLIYKTKIPISNIGFGEILFKTEALRRNKGMSESFKIGDTFIKKKLALIEPVLFVSIGFMFWRQSPNQASKKVANGISSFLERVAIDRIILSDKDFPIVGQERDSILQNVRIGILKIFIRSTLLKGKLIDFFKYRKHINFQFKDFFLLLRKGDYSYIPSDDLGNPLMNDYNFSKSKNHAQI